MTVYELLRQIREQRDNPLLPLPNCWNKDLSLFHYQKVAVSHLIGLKRFIIADPTGSGKTPTALFSWALYRDRYPQSRLIVPTTTSAVTQWGEETARFLPGVRCFRAHEEGPEGRREIYRDWIAGGGGSALVLSWNVLLRDHEFLLETVDRWREHTWVVGDEIQKIKSPKSQLYKMMEKICGSVEIVHGLTATLVKNKVHDAFNILHLLVPEAMSRSFFEKRYCLYGKRRVPIRTGDGGGRQLISVKHLEGYRDIDDFAYRMSNLYIARTDDELDMERPKIRHIFRSVAMSPTHRRIYRDSEQGLFIEGAENDSAAARSALSHAQIAANSPEHFSGRTPFSGSDWDLFSPEMVHHPEYSKIQKQNSKLELLLDLLDGELEDEPVLIYSSFSSTIFHLSEALKRFHPVVITGATPAGERDEARHAFQDGTTNLILITDAGGEALNLQRAGHIIMYSRPWDPGRYVQVIGRARRFASPHKFIGVWHLTVKDSVDELVDSVLNSKLGGFTEIVRNATSLPQVDTSLPLEVVRRMRQNRLRG